MYKKISQKERFVAKALFGKSFVNPRLKFEISEE
jgi:hypothetical protein